MKQIYLPLLTLILFCIPMKMKAADFVVDGLSYNYLEGENEVELTELVENPLLGTTDYPAEVTVPSTVTYKDVTYSVVAIGDKAFYFSDTVEKISLPESIRSIGEEAFANANLLAEVNIPQGVTFIGERAFSTCPKIKSIVLPEGLTALPDQIFYSCRGLRQLTLPSTLESIGYASMRFCRALTSIEIPVGVKEIGETAFAQCSALETIQLPENLEVIGESAFSGCEALVSISFPESVKSYGNNICYGCTHLEEVTLPSTISGIPNYMFYQCTALESIEIPASVVTVGKYAFEYSGLKSLTIPATVLEIGLQAFDGLASLKTLTFEDGEAPLSIGKGYLGKPMFSDSPDIATLYYGRNFVYEVTPMTTLSKIKNLTIGRYVTDVNSIKPANNLNLQEIEVLATVPPVIGEFDSYVYETATLTVPKGTKEAYAAAEVWKNFVNVEESAQSSAASDVDIDFCGEAQWFDIQGKRVANPQHGLFIRVEGNKSSKVMIK